MKNAWFEQTKLKKVPHFQIAEANATFDIKVLGP